MAHPLDVIFLCQDCAIEATWLRPPCMPEDVPVCCRRAEQDGDQHWYLHVFSEEACWLEVGPAFFVACARCLYLLVCLWDVLCCNLQGRKINFTNTKTLVGWCRDRPWRALLLTCPNVKNLQKIKTKQNEKKRKGEKKEMKKKTCKKCTKHCHHSSHHSTPPHL